jgi:HPt (histidine-containing phosphotransfer) domain-containing protein
VPQQADSPAVPTGGPHAPALDRGAVQQLEEQLAPDVLAGLVRRFLAGAPARIARLRDAALAADAPRLREEANAFKAAARGFGAAELAEIAFGIERRSAAGAPGDAAELLAALGEALERTRAELDDQLGRTAADRGVFRIRAA